MNTVSPSSQAAVSRFVVLRHEMPSGTSRPSHWDLMLEDDGQLLTWALAALPQLSRTCPAERLARHRIDYLEYEGPVSGNRGQVARWDAGTFCWISRSTECHEISLAGEKLRGQFVLRRDVTNEVDGQRWLLSWVSSDDSAT